MLYSMVHCKDNQQIEHSCCKKNWYAMIDLIELTIIQFELPVYSSMVYIQQVIIQLVSFVFKLSEF